MSKDLEKYSNTELLKMMFGEAANNIASQSLASLFGFSTKRLVVNENEAVYNVNEKFLVAGELMKRALHEEVMDEEAVTLSSPTVVKDYLRVLLGGREYEVFVVIFQDPQHRVIAVEEMFRGTLTQASVYPREVVKRALHHNARGIMLCHNHPSGNLEPSDADRTLTVTLEKALRLVDVRVHDHFVVAGQNIMSFAERGMI